MSTRSLKKARLLQLLRSGEIDAVVAELIELQGRGFVKPLRSALCHDEASKWSAVTALGLLTAALADRDLESARVVMRTLIWSTTEESGGIPWGVTEAMAEIMACHEGLASEYAPILVSYTSDTGNYLEHVPLQRGVLWGIGRLAQVRPALVRAHEAADHLPPYLDSSDAPVRGLAAWALGFVGASGVKEKLQALQADRAPLQLYLDRELVDISVGALARQALAAALTDYSPGKVHAGSV